MTLGLLRALRRRGVAVVSAKTGPDYIDPAFHAAATGQDCATLDPWCADAAQLRARAGASAGGMLVVEGAMGLFDGAPAPDTPLGHGSTADAAAALGLPVVLVVDAAKTAQTVAAMVAGLAGFRADVRIAGVILNRIGSPRHEAMLRAAVETVAPVLGAIPRSAILATPSRHLGLVQAQERGDLERFVEGAADIVSAHCDADALVALAEPVATGAAPARLAPLGQRIAVARDVAFGFAYPHMLADWRAAGAEIVPFSPLADETPDARADAVFLPGGYPELHAGTLASATRFRAGMHAARDRGAVIHGECGGYMTLGAGMIDADGARHAMLGLLDVETSFAQRRLHLGYRRMTACVPLPWGGAFRGHEFHYATTLGERGEPLFALRDSMDADLGTAGLRSGTVTGSFAHIVEAGQDDFEGRVFAPRPGNRAQTEI